MLCPEQGITEGGITKINIMKRVGIVIQKRRGHMVRSTLRTRRYLQKPGMRKSETSPLTKYCPVLVT